MKKLLLNTFLAFCLFSHLAGQTTAPISMEDRLKTVTVYPKQARMEYEGTLSVPLGESKIIFTNLPSDIHWGSVELSLANASISIENISVNANYLKTKEPDPEIVRLGQLQDSLQQVLTWASHRKEMLDGEETLLKSNQQVYSQQAGVTANALKQLIDFQLKESTRIKRERADNNLVVQQTQDHLSAVQKQIGKLREPSRKGVTEVWVDVRAQKATTVDYNLSMLSPNASWRALYDIHATSTDAPLQVRFRAIVKQSTGENWKDVKLLLSTAQPALNNQHPVTEPLYARILPLVVEYAIANEPVTYQESMIKIEKKPEEEVWSDKKHNLTSAVFTLNGNQTIPSDGADHYVTIRDLDIPANVYHYAVPRASPHVYLIAEILNTSDYDLQSGTARIFNESTYIGETAIDIKNLTDTLLISLGIDQGVYVKRERRDFGATQWLGLYRQETFDFAISIRNNKPAPIQLKLLDQIPISTDKQIEISLLKKDNAVHDEVNGNLTWQVRCAPGNTEVRNFSYRIKYPKDNLVDGKW